MNRPILKYSYPVTAVILLVFAWVVSRRLAGGVAAIIPLAVAATFVWVVGSLVFIYYWPWITVGGFKRAILKRGFGGGPIPVNTLYAVLDRPSQSASTSSVMGTGADDLHRRLARRECRTASVVCARDGRALLQHAAH